MRTPWLPVGLTAALVCSAGWPARAQVAAGAITGRVTDQAGAAVPGAAITVTDTRTNLRRVIVSTGDGVYTAASLAPGEYRIDVELAGFKPLRREGVRVSTGERPASISISSLATSANR
jgi:protocatechuate 3,4-dioxygenase beta subunit